MKFLWTLVLAMAAALPAAADSSSPLLAAYYDRQMAIVGGYTYAWQGIRAPRRLPMHGVQVGVGRDTHYVLSDDGKLIGFRDAPARTRTLMTGVATFAAGDSGVLAIKKDATLWKVHGFAGEQQKIANDVVTAAIGDGANYFVTTAGDLFVRGAAHRGQYGDGELQASQKFVQTAQNVAHISAHTGHAILLKASGDVFGTGGNIYGPVGKHGLGDKAVRWSKIAAGAIAVATGSSHSVAIRRDATLIAWGSEYGTDPVVVLRDVTAVAAGSFTTIALRSDGSLWQWGRGRAPRRVNLK